MGHLFGCVHCGSEVERLYKSYGPGTISLMKCDACGAIADPYVEYDWVLVYLELALLKLAMFRHVLCNEEVSFPRIARLSLLILMLELFSQSEPLDPDAPFEMIGASVNVVLRYGVQVCIMYALFWRRIRRWDALLMAFLIGSIIPKCLYAMSMVWDYAKLPYATYLLRGMLVGARSVALSAATRGNIVISLITSSALTFIFNA